MPICAFCGLENSETAAYCDGCGHVLYVDRPAPPPEEPILVGRRKELDLLLAAFDDAVSGSGRLAMLAGEAGIGKTWIAREVARQAAARGAVVMWGSCQDGNAQPPYGLWAEAFGGYVRADEPDVIGQALGEGAPAISQIVPEVRALLPSVPPAPPLSPDEERLRLYEASVRFLLSIARQTPVLLVLDDLHWADPDSLGLLQNLARFAARSRILVIGTYRDVDLDHGGDHPILELLAILHRDAAFRQIPVRGLARKEVAEYLALTAGQALPSSLADTIHSQTGGNPFYVRELLRHLLEEHKILRRAGHWSIDLGPDELGIPEGVRLVVDRRVARLSEETGKLLRLAAVFKGSFAFEPLQAVLEMPDEELLGCLDEALTARLLCVVEGPVPKYDFAHAIVRQTLYERLNPDRRVRLHRRVAQAMERVYADKLEKHAAEIASQYHASSGLSGAAAGVPYALSAAEQARKAYSHERTVTFLQMARDLAEDAGALERANILCKLAVAQADALQLDDASQTTEDALETLDRADAGNGEGAAFLAQIARALKEGGAGQEVWEPFVNRGLSLCGEPRDLVWARLTLLGGRVEPVSGAAIPAARWVGPDSQALDIARAAGDEDDYSRTLESLEQRTLEETRAELAVVRTWTRPTAIMRALGVLGRDLLKQRDGFREAAGLYRELLAIGERYGSIAAQGEALLELAIMQGNFGEFQLAQANARRAQELIARLGPAHELHFQAGGLAVTLAYFMEADWAAMAARLSGFAATLWRARSPRAHLVSACAALCHARAGNFEAAREQLVSLTPVIADIKPDIYVHQVVVLFASTVVWEIGAVELAADYLRLAHTIVDAGFGGNLLPHELTIARMAALNGDMVDARDHFDLAREELDSGGQRASRAIVDYDEALALVRNGSTDRVRILELLDAAESAFAALGMAGWTERAARLKETLQTPAPSCGSRELSSGLTSRETEVLRLLALGRTNREIAEILVLSPKTVEHHVAHLYTKIQVRGRVDAASYALRNGIVGPAEPSST